MFELIHKHNLFNVISGKIILLIDFDKQRALDLMLDNTDRIPVNIFIASSVFVLTSCHESWMSFHDTSHDTSFIRVALHFMKHCR